MLSALKKRIKLLIHLLPWGESFLMYFNPRALGIAYRGVFENHESALQAVRPDRTADYDDAFNQQVAERIEAGEVDITRWLHDYDYPMLFWLARALQADSRVVEFGGSLGHLFYSIRDLFPLEDTVDWTILELREAVSAGRRLASRMGEKRLKFEVSNFDQLDLQGDVFVSAGALQYAMQSTTEWLDRFAQPPTHIVLHTMPARQGAQFWTLQRIDETELPYRVLSIPALIEEMQGRGYETISQWRQDREVRIPFRDRYGADGYYGFYFRKAADSP
ncbi:MAG: methyltransferase, TIGR04325 family [Pseudomonadota bacterium]